MSKIDYEIFEQIGKGLRGVVFRGLDIKNKREVAIKRVMTSANTNKEIDNHLLLNSLDNIPTLYDYFDEIEDNRKFTYMVQKILYGDGLHNVWKANKNWDFMWMTLYHAIKVIEDFHNLGYLHGDLHLNNFVWSGDKMWLIDFDKMINVPRRIEELEDKRIKLEKELPSDYLDVYDYDPFDDIRGELYGLKHKFCEDYVGILTTSQFSRLGDYNSFENINHGQEKYMMLMKYYRKCRDYETHKNFSSDLLNQYNLIDEMKL